MTNSSIMSHVSLGTNSFARAKAFYSAVLATIGAQIIMEHDNAVAFGKAYPEFWLQSPHDGRPADCANGVHIAFQAGSKGEVDAFHETAIALGATDDGQPGARPEYGAPYYGCFVRDLDGHKIEATFWDMELAGT